MTTPGRSTIEYVPTVQLIPYARNARTHSDTQVAQIAGSIREFGFTNPILVDGDGGIIAGHGRVLAASRLAMEALPCIRLTHLTDAQKRAYVIADNKLALNAGWDDALLAVEFADLAAAGYDLALTGFSDDEIAELLNGGTSSGLTDPDDEPSAPETPVTVPGDVWVLGNHRLMCGDCRNSDDLELLLAGRKINLAFTSPPYAEQREYDASSGFRPIPPEQYVEWFAPVAANIAAALADGGSWFVNIKPPSEGLDTDLYVFDLVIAHVRQWGWHFATEFCWERNGVPKSVTQRFKNQFEPVYQFARGRWKMNPEAVRHESANVPRAGGPGVGNTSWKTAQGGNGEMFGAARMRKSNLIGGEGGVGQGRNDTMDLLIGAGLAYPGNRLPTFAGSHDATGHAAAFPVGLPEFFVKAYTDAADTVFDPFVGSGSTIMAAERTERHGLGMEISPQYCDIAVTRWQNFTGKRATLESTGEPFPQ